MLFNDPYFIFGFLPIMVLFGAIITVSLRKSSNPDLYRSIFIIVVTIASFYFYSYERFSWIYILISSVLINYCFMRLIIAGKQRSEKTAKVATTIGVIFNLALLGYFKYALFFAENLLGLGAISNIASWAYVALPIGISFYTFQQIAYLCDTYSGKMDDISFWRYAFFVSFFPQLIAGPIVHHSEIMPQLKNFGVDPLSRNMVIGLTLFFCGLVKKLLLADSVAPISDEVFSAVDAGTAISMISAWQGLLAYTFQIYFDFSGYSDMAIGIGFMFGLKLPVNFSSPYQSRSIIEFWRRWHITLSNFLRDYLYIPLGGNRKGKSRRFINLFLTMLLGGLWHGAGWGFVVWGMLHGVYLMINHGLRSFGITRILGNLPGFSALSWAITILAASLAWMPFRAETFSGAKLIWMNLVNANTEAFTVQSATPFALIILLVCGIVAFILPNSQQICSILYAEKHLRESDPMPIKSDAVLETPMPIVFAKGYLAFLAILSVTALALNNKVAQFIYFQF